MMIETKDNAMDRGGFTLVELLVVIGIIAVLASLLLPALARAKQRGHRAACLSNLRQIGIAFMLHNDDHESRFPDRRDLKSSLPGGYRPWTTWPPSDPRGGWAAVVLRDYLGDAAVWACPSGEMEPFRSAAQCAQASGPGANATVTRYWLWRFDNQDPVVPLDNFWGKTETGIVSDLQAAAVPTIGIPSGPVDVELAVDPYFPGTIASVAPALKGRAVHAGGRNRLYLDGHAEFFRDHRTPR
jgi:prepilin-type N-terminal cleavage/methylation domain-containing protein/prepilin-type processing-associated H-X9-DG protein